MQCRLCIIFTEQASECVWGGVEMVAGSVTVNAKMTVHCFPASSRFVHGQDPWEESDEGEVRSTASRTQDVPLYELFFGAKK